MHDRLFTAHLHGGVQQMAQLRVEIPGSLSEMMGISVYTGWTNLPSVWYPKLSIGGYLGPPPGNSPICVLPR